MNAAREINPRAATLRDESGAIVGSTCGDTACWHPRRPGNYVSFNQDGDEVAIPCRDCPGCREFYRRHLAERLYEHFKAEEDELWELRIVCGLSEQSNVCSRLNHSRIGPSLRGWCRVGADGVALIVSGKNPRSCAPRFVAKLACGWKRIRLNRGRRAFASITAGMVRARAEYGEQTNRFYFRGVKSLPREFTWSRPSGYGRGLKNRVGGGEMGRTIRARRDGVSVHLPEEKWIAMLKAQRSTESGRSANMGARLASIVESVISSSVGNAAPRSGVQLSRRAPGRCDDDDRGARREAIQSAGANAPVPSSPPEHTLNSIKGVRYSSSSYLTKWESDPWVVKMLALKRAKEGGDDG